MVPLNSLYDFPDRGFPLICIVTFVSQLSVTARASQKLVSMALHSCGSLLGQRLNLFWFSARTKLFIASY